MKVILFHTYYKGQSSKHWQLPRSDENVEQKENLLIAGVNEK